jgi:hypothetical protein
VQGRAAAHAAGFEHLKDEILSVTSKTTLP